MREQVHQIKQSRIHFVTSRAGIDPGRALARRRERAKQVAEALRNLTSDDPALQARLDAVSRFARSIRVSEYHLTNVCNIRCEGCWFFEYEHDKETREEKSLSFLEEFIAREHVSRRVNCALIIGGEPTLFPERLRLFVRHMKYVTISSNGLERLPRAGFENVAIGLTLFGGGPLDDQLRAIKPSGKRFTGLFDTALA